MEPIKLKSIEEEAADCRAAFEGSKVGDLVNFCHHEEPIEALMEPAEERIAYILAEKYPWEQALRLRLFRPIKGKHDMSWYDVSALRAIAVAYYEANLAKKKAREEGNHDEAIRYDALVTGLYRAASLVSQKLFKEYPFEELFGTEWEGAIFTTFKYEQEDTAK